VYARFVRLFFLARYDIPFWSLRAQRKFGTITMRQTAKEYRNMICWSPNWNEPQTYSGTPRFGNRFGDSPFRYGDCFLCAFFFSRTRSDFSHLKLRQSGCCAAAATAAATTTAATAAATAGCHASSAATNSSSCRLLFSPRHPPSRLLVSSVVAPDVDEHARLKPILHRRTRITTKTSWQWLKSLRNTEELAR
jgi:hypothetical protein